MSVYPAPNGKEREPTIDIPIPASRCWAFDLLSSSSVAASICAIQSLSSIPKECHQMNIIQSHFYFSHWGKMRSRLYCLNFSSNRLEIPLQPKYLLMALTQPYCWQRLSLYLAMFLSAVQSMTQCLSLSLWMRAIFIGRGSWRLLTWPPLLLLRLLRLHSNVSVPVLCHQRKCESGWKVRMWNDKWWHF